MMTKKLLQLAGVNYASSHSLGQGLKSFAATLAVSEVKKEVVPIARLIYRDAESNFYAGRVTSEGLVATPFLPGTAAPNAQTVGLNGGFLSMEDLAPSPAPTPVIPANIDRTAPLTMPAPNPETASAWSRPMVEAMGFDAQAFPAWTELAEVYLQTNMTGFLETAALDLLGLPLLAEALDRVLKLLGIPTGSGRRMARLGDATTHGGTLTSGASRTLFGNKPAVRVTDQHTCANSDHNPGMVTSGNTRILIEGQWASGEALATSCGAQLQPGEGDIVMEQNAAVEAEIPHSDVPPIHAPPETEPIAAEPGESEHKSLLYWADKISDAAEKCKEVVEVFAHDHPEFQKWLDEHGKPISKFVKDKVEKVEGLGKALVTELKESGPEIEQAVSKLGKFAKVAQESKVLKFVPFLGTAAAAQEGYNSRSWLSPAERAMDAENAASTSLIISEISATGFGAPVGIIDTVTLGAISAFVQWGRGNPQAVVDLGNTYRHIGNEGVQLAIDGWQAGKGLAGEGEAWLTAHKPTVNITTVLHFFSPADGATETPIPAEYPALESAPAIGEWD